MATIQFKTGRLLKIDLADPTIEIFMSSSELFLAVERYFEDWYESAAPYQQQLYQGEEDDPAPYVKKGAIHDGIEIILDYMVENKISRIHEAEFYKIDIEASFT